MADRTARRAQNAARLLGHDVFLDAVKAVEDELVVEWAAGKNEQAREACWHELHAFGRLIGRLEGFVADHPDIQESVALQNRVHDARNSHSIKSRLGRLFGLTDGNDGARVPEGVTDGGT